MATCFDVLECGRSECGYRSTVIACHGNPVEYGVIERYPPGQFDLIDCVSNAAIIERASWLRITDELAVRGLATDQWYPFTDQVQVCELAAVIAREEVAG